MYCDRDLQEVLRTQLLCNTTASVPPEACKCTSELIVRRAISTLSCIVLYCILLYTREAGGLASLQQRV